MLLSIIIPQNPLLLITVLYHFSNYAELLFVLPLCGRHLEKWIAVADAFEESQRILAPFNCTQATNRWHPPTL